MNSSFPQSHEGGFTRIELAGVVLAIALLAAVALPGLASSRRGSELTVCSNNLRRIGQAHLFWGASHGGQRSFWTPAPEGTFSTFKPGNAWAEYYVLRAELGGPGILACPADERSVKARAWAVPAGEPGHASFRQLRDTAVSYFVGLHADLNAPGSFLAGDYHLTVPPGISACSAGVNNATAMRINDSHRWTNAVHGPVGNILFNDGSVSQLSSPGLEDAVAAAAGVDNGLFHILFPNK